MVCECDTEEQSLLLRTEAGASIANDDSSFPDDDEPVAASLRQTKGVHCDNAPKIIELSKVPGKYS